MPRIAQSPRILSKLAAVLAAGTMFTLAAPLVTPVALSGLSAAKAQEPSQFKSILAGYGDFQAHAKYGEVWVPGRSIVPEGWHPYPACNWVHTKDLGWYFDDKTEWGKIVHHYGRWAHDKDLGWVWVKGDEFSPGWVVWRTSDKWVGWAPMPPEQDLREISATEFNNDKHWTFMDAKKFGTKCDGGQTIVSTPPALYPVIFEQTKLVTEIKFVGGIAIFVLPPPLIVNIVDIHIGIFHPWSPCFFGAWFWQWNALVNTIVINININNNNCPVPILQKQPIPIISTPPPGPGSKPRPNDRADLPPPLRPQLPPLSRPERPQLPPMADPVRPRPERPESGSDRPTFPEGRPQRPQGPFIPPIVMPERPRPDRPDGRPTPKPERPNDGRPNDGRPPKPQRPQGPVVDVPPIKVPPIKVPPIVMPDRPKLPPVFDDRPQRPSGPVIVDKPRFPKPSQTIPANPRSGRDDVVRRQPETSRQQVPRVTRLDKPAQSLPRASQTQRQSGPVIR